MRADQLIIGEEIETSVFCMQHLHGISRGPYRLSAAGDLALRRIRSELSFDGILLLMIAANFDRLLTDFPNKFSMVYEGKLVECKRVTRFAHHRQHPGQSRRSRSDCVWRLSEKTIVSRRANHSDRDAYQALWKAVCQAIGVEDGERVAALAPHFSLMKCGSANVIRFLLHSLPGHCVGAYIREYRRFAVAFGVPDLPTLPLTGYLTALIACYKDLGVSETEYELDMASLPFKDCYGSDKVQLAAQAEFGPTSLIGFAISTENESLLDFLSDFAWTYEPALTTAIKAAGRKTILRFCHLAQRGLSNPQEETPIHLLVRRLFSCDGITESDFIEIIEAFKKRAGVVYPSDRYESARELVLELAAASVANQMGFDTQMIERVCASLTAD